MGMIRLLIVDDEKLTREGIAGTLPFEELGISGVSLAQDGQEALELCEKMEFQIVLTDVRMPRIDGVELSKILKVLYPTCKIIFMSGYSDKEYLINAIEVGALKYIEKPIHKVSLAELLKHTVQLCVEEQKSHQEKEDILLQLEIGQKLLQKEFVFLLTNKNGKISAYPHVKKFSKFLNHSMFVTVIIKL